MPHCLGLREQVARPGPTEQGKNNVAPDALFNRVNLSRAAPAAKRDSAEERQY